jgi:hypothetical protein
MTLPLAHVGHYFWVLYLLPVVFVVIAIVKTTLSERRASRQPDEPSPSQAPVENSGPEDLPPAGGTRRDAENENLARRRPSS